MGLILHSIYSVHDTVALPHVGVSFYFLQPLEGSQIPLISGFIILMTGPWVPTTLLLIMPPPPALHPFFIEVARVLGHSEVRTSAAATLLGHRLYCSPRPQCQTLLGYSQSLLKSRKEHCLVEYRTEGLSVWRLSTSSLSLTVAYISELNSILIHACPCWSALEILSWSPPTAGCAPRSLLVCSRLYTRGRMPLECRWIH